MLERQPLELTDHRRVLAEAEPAIDPLLDGGQPELLELDGAGSGEVRVGELRVRVAAPNPERLFERGDGVSYMTRGRGHTRARHRPRETVGVELAVGERER